ncbi:MAG: indole-3-glycerol phosphate synthase TrpC [Coriobacteriales bacterium]|jgi:indole-3-glycerol phosphate synthase
MRQPGGILQELADSTLKRCEDFKAANDVSALIDEAERIADSEKVASQALIEDAGRSNAAGRENTSPAPLPFEAALSTPGMSFICEVKKASPSKGVIAEDFPYLDIAREYESAGASAISCLTEPHWFKGSCDYLRQISAEVSIPVLRKDFTVDEVMVYRAKVIGASAVLLICSILDDDEISRYSELATRLGMSSLVEAHDAEEVRRAVALGSRIVGVNNRNLKDFTVDIDNSAKLREMIPNGTIYVSESGIRTRDDVAKLEEIGVDAVLIGEKLMRSENKRKILDELRGVGK